MRILINNFYKIFYLKVNQIFSKLDSDMDGFISSEKVDLSTTDNEWLNILYKTLEKIDDS